MKYTVINNNKQNFKVQYEVDGLEQQAHLQGDTTHYGRLITGNSWVRIARHQNATRNAYGKIYGAGEEITQHHMTEEELFQNSLVDPLTHQKKIAGLLLDAFYSNNQEMTVELLDTVLN
ncbi:hypothetical protein EOL00_27755, partial [Citrobacter freundii]